MTTIAAPPPTSPLPVEELLLRAQPGPQAVFLGTKADIAIGFISWWIDSEGFAIPERAGRVRWFVRPDADLEWGDSPAELAARGFQIQNDDGSPIAKSVTFVPAKVQDNRILLARDPGYLSNLMALRPVERARLLGGNWRIKPAAGLAWAAGARRPRGARAKRWR